MGRTYGSARSGRNQRASAGRRTRCFGPMRMPLPRMSMPQGPRPDHAPTVDRLQRKKLLAEFDRAWRNGTPPLIEGALPADAKDLVTSDSAWRDLLEELVKIDLGYRW